MEETGAGGCDEQIDDGDAIVYARSDEKAEKCITQHAYKSEDDAEEVELSSLGQGDKGQLVAKVYDSSVEKDVEPGADGVLGRELPSLQAVAMIEVVSGLPEVEHFVTILDWGVYGCEETGHQEEGESESSYHDGGRSVLVLLLWS